MVKRRSRQTEKVGAWLTRQFLSWESAKGKRKTLGDFARYLGIKRATLEKWLYGSRTPGRRHVGQIAAKLGPEIYDLLGMPRPDLRLAMIVEAWSCLSEADRDDFARIVADRLSGAPPAARITGGGPELNGSPQITP